MAKPRTRKQRKLRNAGRRKRKVATTRTPPKRSRNYKREYARRLRRGLAGGLTRAQARGHARASATTITRKRLRPLQDRKFQQGLRLLRLDRTLGAIAKELGISRERFVRLLKETGAAKKRGAKWLVRDDLPRRVQLYSGGKEIVITVANRRAASLVGMYMSHVKQFRRTNDPRWLSLFVGKAVTDIDGRRYVFETDPNRLYQLAISSAESFELVYRIVV